MKQLMLIHGAIGSADQMVPLKELLQDEFEVHLLAFDGHGSKSASVDPFSLESFGQQLIQKLSEIGKPTHIFGYSMGGFVALYEAAMGSENIASITTLGTKMEWDEEIAQREVRHLDPKMILSKVPKFATALEKRHGEDWEEVLSRTAAFMKELGKTQPIQESIMKTIEIPVLLCLADGDAMVSVGETHQVHQWIIDSIFETIPDSKHPIEQVNLMALADTIRSFINRLD